MRVDSDSLVRKYATSRSLGGGVTASSLSGVDVLVLGSNQPLNDVAWAERVFLTSRSTPTANTDDPCGIWGCLKACPVKTVPMLPSQPS